jgi:hypothetical protein
MAEADDSGQLDRVRSLLAELKAIELWDAVHWFNNQPEPWETISVLNRRKRRAEILSELRALLH